ncbi:hypothetical protein RUM43_010366 [Polyplax serrata]|uniref:Uncharacterized protein n=1 Tax=Polyplax serrata TaxID=468196 RepID=A0AAN8P7A7_POLSC
MLLGTTDTILILFNFLFPMLTPFYTSFHLVLHRDIEAHRKIVSSIYKLCEKADASTLLAARALERKYHEYYLRSLEWQYHIESLVDLQLNKVCILLAD